MAWCVGYDCVAVSDARYVPVEEGVSRAEGGSGRGSENRREDCSSRAVGELYAFDMAARYRAASAALDHSRSMD